MINSFEIFPGQNVGEFFLEEEDECRDEHYGVNNTHPSGVQLSGILGTPDEPELNILVEALGMLNVSN
jgi:hypothetical protein